MKKKIPLRKVPPTAEPVIGTFVPVNELEELKLLKSKLVSLEAATDASVSIIQEIRTDAASAIAAEQVCLNALKFERAHVELKINELRGLINKVVNGVPSEATPVGRGLFV